MENLYLKITAAETRNSEESKYSGRTLTGLDEY